MSAQAVRLTDIDIDNALQNAHLELAFQPVVRFSDNVIIRYEALVRWEHPGLGPLPPGAFLSFFESRGRIGELTRYVLQSSLSAARHAGLDEDVGISINLSLADMSDKSLPDTISEQLEKYDWPAERLTLECPLFSPDIALSVQAESYAALAETGCPLALEVRGRANDAMKRFDPFVFAEIKTGGPAVLRQVKLSRGGPGLNTLSELLTFARQRDVKITAVGVEDRDASTSLASLGFDLGQGNALGRATIWPCDPIDLDDCQIAEESAQAEIETVSADDSIRRERILEAKKRALKRLKAKQQSETLKETDQETVASARALQSKLEKTYQSTDEISESTSASAIKDNHPTTEADASIECERVHSLLEKLPAQIRDIPSAETATVLTEESLKSHCQHPDDRLDETVSTLAELPVEQDDQEESSTAPLSDSAEPTSPPYWLHLLEKKYRITHFWPRSWRRWARQRKAEKDQMLSDDGADNSLSCERREQNPVPVMSKGEEDPLVFGPMADLR